MKTFSFIGSDKNAGKTTSFNYIVDQLVDEYNKEQGSSPLLLTSIGLNGEMTDNFEGHGKPTISIPRHHFFLTSGEHLQHLGGAYSTVKTFTPPHFKKTFVLGKALHSFELVLEGPNEAHELITLKNKLKELFPHLTLLIDGSIDRQCIASPEISDAFYFALLLSSRPEQLRKASDLLGPFYFSPLPQHFEEILKKQITASCKSILLDCKTEKTLHCSAQIPFLDDQLKKVLDDCHDVECLLYLGGALTPSLYSYLSSFRHLTIVLDNFTLYHNITVKASFDRRTFLPQLHLLHPMKIERIFIKDEGGKLDLDLSKLPITNIFRQERR